MTKDGRAGEREAPVRSR